jgi:hypothetical protein
MEKACAVISALLHRINIKRIWIILGSGIKKKHGSCAEKQRFAKTYGGI